MFRSAVSRRGRRGFLGLLAVAAAALAVPAAVHPATADAAVPAPRAAHVTDGYVDLYLDRAVSDAMNSDDVHTYAVGTSTKLASWDVPVIRIPLRGGEVQTSPYSGTFSGGWLHFGTGGVGFRQGTRTLELSRFDVDLSKGVVRAVVNNDITEPFTLMTFHVNPDQVEVNEPLATLAGVETFFSPEAAVLFNTAFGRPLLTSEEPAGMLSAHVVMAQE